MSELHTAEDNISSEWNNNNNWNLIFFHIVVCCINSIYKEDLEFNYKSCINFYSNTCKKNN